MNARRHSGVMSLCLVALLAFVGATAAPQPAAAAETAVTLHEAHRSHHPAVVRELSAAGGLAPMLLMTYAEVRPWARAIKQKTSTREMPPWFIEPDVGVQHFKNDPSLSADEIEMVAHWVDSGAARGNPADMHPAREYLDRTQWAIGEPHLIVEGPQVLVKAVAPDYHRELGPVATGLAEDRYIAAVEVQETRLDGSAFRNEKGSGLNLFALHHAGIRELGFDMDAPDGFYLIYEVGQNATFYPADTGVRLRGDSALTYTVHMHSVGRDIPVRVDVGFKFHPHGYEPKYKQSGYNAGLVGGSNVREDLALPPGNDAIRYDNFQTMSEPGILTTFEPHLHMSGDRMCVEALYPNGFREILNCSGYDHNWVRTYVYEDDYAPLLPKGTILHIMGWYNNSETNPNNIEPRNWKTGGNRSVEEMFVFLPKLTLLTDEQFAAEVARREALQLSASTNQQND